MPDIPAIGSRAQVWHGNAHHTSGGLTRDQLKKNKHGRIVSRRKSLRAKRAKLLIKRGFVTKKGVFKLFGKSNKLFGKSDGTRRRRQH